MKKRGLITIATLMGILLIIVIYIIIKIYNIVEEHKEIIYPGISINEIDVSLLSKERAIKKLEENSEKLNSDKNIVIYSQDEEYRISFKDLGVEENIEQMVGVALSYGKKDNRIKQLQYIKSGIYRNFKTSITFSEEAFHGVIKIIEKEQNKEPIDATINHEQGRFNITPHEMGRTIDQAALRLDIRETIETNKGESDIEVNLVFKEEEPSICEEDLRTIDSLISTYTTTFQQSANGRSKNIEVAASYVNNEILMPGEEFSFNKVVGATTSSKGYSYAKVIKNGKYVDEIGGGICQVSSTLYNAVLKTNLSITERRNHSKVIDYVPRGQDAMIAYGASDLKFVNNYEYPIFIEAVVINKVITVNVYSNKETGKYIYQVSNEIAKEVKPKKEIIYDYGMNEGATIVEQEGKNGYIINTYRIRYESGKIIEKILVAESVYPGKNTVVRIGKD